MATRHTVTFNGKIEFSFWLAFSKNGEMRMSRGEMALAAHERAMHCTARIPQALFKAPSLTAEIEVPATTNADGVITAEVRMAAEHALKQILGLDVVLSVSEQAK